MAVEQSLGVVLHDFLHGVQGAVHHQRRFTLRIVALSLFFSNGCRRVTVGKEVLRAWLLGRLGGVKGFLHGRVNFRVEQVELRLFHARGQHERFELGQRVALGRFVQVVAVELAAHSTRVVAQQRHAGVHHEGALFLSGGADGVLHGVAAGFPIGAVHRQDFDAREGLGKGGGVPKTDFRAVGADVPFVVLNEPHHGQLTQGRHVKGLGHFALGHGGVADAAE